MKEWICREMSTSTSCDKNGILMIEKELIRCKDCVHWCPLLDSDHPNTENCKTAYCTLHSIHFVTPREGYCYTAERRKDGID